ncbi:hypothetical protein [Pseudomonas chlororaphis]|uniref:hypothetical protein n=1 Tax=Pseudomonas chlororaphis TaxID=587753 RepID=UPI0015DF20D8|nr:hypothetical protein [Pseudomonas chlororaphis]QLL11733.1 hypothetical protein H0I86_22270 [Pseudomonas chlororaphis subsp. aurantiaca]
MSRQHQIAIDMIDARFLAFARGESSDSLHAETSMAIEMAYSLGAISDAEHRHYVARRKRIIEREHDEFMARMSRSA